MIARFIEAVRRWHHVHDYVITVMYGDRENGSGNFECWKCGDSYGSSWTTARIPSLYPPLTLKLSTETTSTAFLFDSGGEGKA